MQKSISINDTLANFAVKMLLKDKLLVSGIVVDAKKQPPVELTHQQPHPLLLFAQRSDVFVN